MTKIKIGLFGFGVVGQGIYEVVRKSKNAHAEIVKICVRDPKKPYNHYILSDYDLL